jgi:hypothetical protein
VSGPETGPAVEACRIRDQGLWEAPDAFSAAFAAASAQELAGSGDAGYYLRLAAVENAIAGQMQIRATISVHRALAGGAAAQEVAHVLGVSAGELAGRWRRWADGQRRLQDRYPGLGLGQAEYGQVAASLEGAGRAAGRPGGGDDRSCFTSCSCPAVSMQIGSPRP